MKKFTKLLGIVLIIALVMSLGAMAFAEDQTGGSGENGSESQTTATDPDTAGTFNYTVKSKTSTDSSLKITNTGKTAHTFELYQIFVGDVDENGTLSNIGWGSGVSTAGQTAYGSAPDKAKTLEDADDAKAFADDLTDKGYLTGAVEKAGIAAGAVAEWTGLNPGYYLVVDKTGSQTGVNSAYTAYVMQVVGTVERVTKIDVPSVEKKVGDANDTAAKAITDPTDASITWADSADHDFGDTIPYKLTGTLPTNLAEYETYTYKFTDSMTHLSYVANSAKVFVDNGGTLTEVKDGFTISGSGASLTVESSDIFKLKANASDTTYITVDKDSKIIVTYQATLDDTAAIGPTGNPNEVTLTYSNNPNKGGEGDKGTTPPDKNIVFTYEVDVNKVERDEAAGTKTAEEYNALVDKTGWVKDEASGKYYKTKALSGADFTLYKEVTSDYAVKTGETVKTGSEIKAALTATNPSVLANQLKDGSYYIEAGKKTGSTAGSTFNFAGVDDGTYVLVETTIPTGYNGIESTTVTVTAEHEGEAAEPKLTSLTVTGGFTAPTTTSGTGADAVTTPTGYITGTIENNKGAVLPSTGGIGTTIFYVVGSIMVVAAGVLLITKKRMGRE